MNTSLFHMVQEPLQWERRIALLRHKGLYEEDLAHWIWILEATDADTKVDRFFSCDRPKPGFVLMAILRKDEEIIKQSSLVKIYDYVAWLCQRKRAGPPRSDDESCTQRAMLGCHDLTPRFFMLILDRLLHHCMMRWPSSIVTVARLVVDYLRAIPEDHKPNKSNKLSGYANRCMIINFAVQHFSRTSRKLLGNLRFNWKAQTRLLAFSAEMKRPCHINKRSYRAIRNVLTGLQKVQTEKATAQRHSKTWPPYIRQLDGLDEAKDTEEYLSRSVRAGILKRQEGYADSLRDRTLDTWGGAVLGESITVQTRSGAPKSWFYKDPRLEIFTAWAARVSATRNAHEAWQMFNESPWPELKPNYLVYAAMFAKLYAKDVNPLENVLPGDTKEVFPPHLGNWTEIERQKLQPCSPEELYERMIRDGNRPVRECLRILLRHASKLKRAFMYLDDSPLDEQAVAHMTRIDEPKNEKLKKIPLPIFDAYIGLLCRQQGRLRWEYFDPKKPPPERAIRKYDNLPRAIKLVNIRLASKRKPAQEPWHTIMRALSAENVILRPYITQAEDDMDSLKQLLALFQTYETTQTLHPFAFHCLCRCLRKVVRHAHVDGVSRADLEVIEEAAHKMKTVFWELVTPVKDTMGLSGMLHDDLPPLFYDVSSANVNIYVETLGLLEEYDEAARAMEWVLAAWSQEGILEKARDPGHKQWQFMMQAFICFRAFCDGHLPKMMMKKIEERIGKLQAQGASWEWPSDELVQAHIQQQTGFPTEHEDNDIHQQAEHAEENGGENDQQQGEHMEGDEQWDHV